MQRDVSVCWGKRTTPTPPHVEGATNNITREFVLCLCVCCVWMYAHRDGGGVESSGGAPPQLNLFEQELAFRDCW